MKPFGGEIILRSKVVQPVECLQYALNLPTSTVITGIENMEVLNQALEAVRTFKPLSAEAVAALVARTEKAARTGAYEQFKTTANFDGTAHHPEWLM